VARARQDQRMVTLDGVERVLDGEMLLINDGGGPVAIAGSWRTRLGDQRRDGQVLLECAYFYACVDPAHLQETRSVDRGQLSL